MANDLSLYRGSDSNNHNNAASYNSPMDRSMKNFTTFSVHSTKFLTTFTPLYWIAVFTAYFLLSRDWAIVRATSTSREHLFGLLGFCVFCAIIYTAYADYRKLSVFSLRNLAMIGIPVLVSLFLLAHTVESTQRSWDYEQYEAAFRAMSVGDNPYLSTRFLYPPFFAEGMVFIYQVGTWLHPAIGMDTKESTLWMFVFYIHQSALLFAILLSYYYSLKFAERIGIGQFKGMIFVSGLFIINIPLLRTLLYNQVNFYILASILLSILALARRPFLSGIAIAVGGLIKLYPFVLIFPLLAIKRWKALAGVFAGVIGIIAIQTNGFRDLVSWKQFILFYMSFPVERESSWFRNSSIMSFLRNFLDFVGAPPNLVMPVFGFVCLLILGWIALRFTQRERFFVQSMERGINLPMENETYRNMGHLIDFSVLSLLVAPSAWEHHYVIAIPLAIWTFAFCKREASWLLSIGLTLVFAMPVFNIFPFSYLRKIGRAHV